MTRNCARVQNNCRHSPAPSAEAELGTARFRNRRSEMLPAPGDAPQTNHANARDAGAAGASRVRKNGNEIGKRTSDRYMADAERAGREGAGLLVKLSSTAAVRTAALAKWTSEGCSRVRSLRASTKRSRNPSPSAWRRRAMMRAWPCCGNKAELAQAIDRAREFGLAFGTVVA